MIESLIALIAAIVGLGIGYLVAKNQWCQEEIFVEQAKAKAKAIEYEAELILKDAKNSILNAELEVKKIRRKNSQNSKRF